MACSTILSCNRIQGAHRSSRYRQSVPPRLACYKARKSAHEKGCQAPATAHQFLSFATTPVPRSQPASGDEEPPLHPHPGPVWPTAGLSRPNTPQTRSGRLTRPSGHPQAEWGPNWRLLGPLISSLLRGLTPKEGGRWRLRPLPVGPCCPSQTQDSTSLSDRVARVPQRN